MEDASHLMQGISDVISALHTLSSFDKTRIDNVIVPFGSGCEQMLTFSVAAPMFERMVGNMDKSFLTTYIWEPLMKR